MSEPKKPIDVGDIISPVLGLDAPKPTIGYGPRDECWRHEPEVQQLARKVVCKRCGTPLDPLDVLVSLTRDAGYIDSLHHERKRLEARIAELKHDEKLTKARLKNANGKDAELAVAKERERLAEMHRTLAYKAEEIGNIADQVQAALNPHRPHRRRKH